jgi:branched-chain amino acid transport system permease protein
MAGGYFGIVFVNVLHLPWAASVVAVVVSAMILGLVLERLVNRPLMRAKSFTVIIATIALGTILRNVARMIWTDDLYSLRPVVVSTLTVPFTGHTVTGQDLVVLASSIVLVVLLYAFFRTTYGKALRAVQQNKRGAELVGIELSTMYGLTWAISAMLAGAAGFLVAPLIGVSPAMGWIGLNGFVAAVIG